jgi:hypothetical protein
MVTLLPNNPIGALAEFLCDSIPLINYKVLVKDLEDLASTYVAHNEDWVWDTTTRIARGLPERQPKCGTFKLMSVELGKEKDKGRYLRIKGSARGRG